MQTINTIDQSTSPTPVHTGCPSFMRAQLFTAFQGGGAGYEEAGFTLGSHLHSQVPNNLELDEWDAELDKVAGFIEDDAALAHWLRQTFPVIMRKVPARRMAKFMAGVRRGQDV